MADIITFRGVAKGHGGWVTSIAASTDEDATTFVSGSRDKSVMLWKLTGNSDSYAHAHRRLRGHSDSVEDVVVSSDGQFAMSASCDNTLRLWDLNSGVTTRLFKGHTDDVLSVAFSSDNRQIVSCGRDRTIRVWNTLGQCKFTIEGPQAKGHTDWVSCVRFSPNTSNPVVVSGGWDKVVKVWRLSDCTLRANFIGHTGYVNTVTVSPDGAFCASGGKDGKVMVWNVAEAKLMFTLDAGDIVNSLSFAPNRYWLCAGTNSGIKVWEVDSLKEIVNLNRNTYPSEFYAGEKSGNAACLSVCWMVQPGNRSLLLSGHADNHIRIWECV